MARWITSRHAIRASLARGTRGTLFLTSRGQKNRDLIATAERAGVPVEMVDGEWLRRHAGDRTRGAALRTEAVSEDSPTVELRPWLEAHTEDDESLIVALDHVTDPQNLGAILRSALLHGTGLVIIPGRRSVTGGDAVMRASAGAARFVPTAVVGNLRQALEQCREAGWWVYGADAGGTALPTVSFSGRAALVLGAEGKGLSPVVRRTCDEIVTIPAVAPPDSGVDSFNVSVAAATVLYEFRRQRR